MNVLLLIVGLYLHDIHGPLCISNYTLRRHLIRIKYGLAHDRIGARFRRPVAAKVIVVHLQRLLLQLGLSSQVSRLLRLLLIHLGIGSGLRYLRLQSSLQLLL